jgi:uncharacterized damage-inducible protein DinB
VDPITRVPEYNPAMALQPEQALVLREASLRSIKAEQATTQRVIEAIPADKGEFKLEEIGKSAIDLAWHIVGAEHKFLDCVVTGAFDFSPAPRPSHLGTAAAIAAWYAETSARDQERVAGASADDLVRIVDFRGIFKAPAVTFLETGLHHSIHHRGQLSTYLRPMGGKVPAIYGESYDSAKAKTGA